jgi:hypothetical protein
VTTGGPPSPHVSAEVTTRRTRIAAMSVLVEQSPRRDSKTTGESPDDADSELALTPLEEADLGTVQAGPIGEDLLRQAGLLPQATHAHAE